jgi:hypothetical protein
VKYNIAPFSASSSLMAPPGPSAAMSQIISEPRTDSGVQESRETYSMQIWIQERHEGRYCYILVLLNVSVAVRT